MRKSSKHTVLSTIGVVFIAGIAFFASCNKKEVKANNIADEIYNEKSSEYSFLLTIGNQFVAYQGNIDSNRCMMTTVEDNGDTIKGDCIIDCQYQYTISKINDLSANLTIGGISILLDNIEQTDSSLSFSALKENTLLANIVIQGYFPETSFMEVLPIESSFNSKTASASPSVFSKIAQKIVSYIFVNIDIDINNTCSQEGLLYKKATIACVGSSRTPTIEHTPASYTFTCE